jgi:hypothetical protein
VVFVKGPEAKEDLNRLIAEKNISVPVTLLPGGPDDRAFKGWKIHPEAKNTVIVYKAHQVLENFVNVDDKSFADVEKATAEMLK